MEEEKTQTSDNDRLKKCKTNFKLITMQLIMIHINNYEITYMGKKCTIGDYVKYNKDLSKCKELEKIGALVYINSTVKNIDIPKKEFCFDVILEYLQFNMDKCNHLAIKVITDKKIKEVPDYLKDLFESNDEDEKYDLFVRFLSDCGVS